MGAPRGGVNRFKNIKWRILSEDFVNFLSEMNYFYALITIIVCKMTRNI